MSKAVWHEAEGYAKSTGKLGVAVVTSGPEQQNAITGIADAMSDSVPLGLCRSGCASWDWERMPSGGGDIVGITMPITKYNYQVRETADIPHYHYGKLSISQRQVVQVQL